MGAETRGGGFVCGDEVRRAVKDPPFEGAFSGFYEKGGRHIVGDGACGTPASLWLPNEFGGQSCYRDGSPGKVQQPRQIPHSGKHPARRSLSGG